MDFFSSMPTKTKNTPAGWKIRSRGGGSSSASRSRSGPVSAFAADRPAAPRGPLRDRDRLEGVPEVLFSRKELDGLTTRSKVIAILSDVGEEVVSRHSPRLAVASFLGSLSDRLVRLLRPEDYRVDPPLPRGRSGL